MRKLALASLILLPVGGLWHWWDAVRQRPALAVLAAFAYEVGLLALAFGKKVWGELEGDAVKVSAEWVREGVRGFAPGFLRRYRERLLSDYGIFNVGGLGLINTFTLKLNQVFVELRIAPSSNPQKANVDLLSKKELSGNRPVWDFLRADGRGTPEETALAIIGAPGCGKTTLLQHIALTLATNRQRRYKVCAYTPLLLFLRDHIQAITRQPAPSLDKLAQDYFSDPNLFPTLRPPPRWFAKQLKRGKLIVLLDGLDEVAVLKQRREISAWVDNQIKNYPRCRFVLTARPQGYHDAPLQHAHVLEVQPFTTQQVWKFIDNWYLAHEIISSGQRDTVEVRQRAHRGARDLLRRLREAPSLNALTVNPLLLTMIAMVHRYHGALPGSRVELYAEICEVLLGRWRQARGVQDPLKSAQKLVVLRALAAHMMARKLRVISTAAAAAVIATPLSRVGVRGQTGEDFLRDLQAGSGLLLEREAGQWTFAHLTFQEYLNAAYWLEQRTPINNWVEMVGESWWHETLRLYAAQGDATGLVAACLEVDSLAALKLAASCLSEAREIDPDVRRAAEDRVINALESTDAARRRLAAEVYLSRRLETLQRIDDEREVDPAYVTCAEYQLFVDDLLEQGAHRQPDHWEAFIFPPGQGRAAVKGVRAEDAAAFCAWLTERYGRGTVYRVPRPDEAGQYPAAPAEADQPVGVWCGDKRGYSLAGLTADEEQEIVRRLAAISDLPPPSAPTAVVRELSPDLTLLDFSTARAARHAAHDEDGAGGIILQSFRALRDVYLHATPPSLATEQGRALLRAVRFTLDLVSAFAVPMVTSLADELTRLRDLNQPRDQKLVSDFFKAHSTVMSQHCHDYKLLGRLQEMIAAREFQKAHDEACRSPGGMVLERAVLLLNELQKVRSAADQVESRMALLRYVDKLLRLTYLGCEDDRQSVLQLYWWFRIVVARREEKLPAWEGVRVVREQVLEASE